MTMIHRKLMAVTALILFLGCIALAPAHKSGAAVTVIADDFSSSTELWHFLGSANLAEDTVELTPSLPGQTGTIWLRQSLNPPFAVDFRFRMSDINDACYCGYNDGADGIVFMFNKEKNVDAISGGGMGFEPGNGYGIEFDTWPNEWDPSGGHIALIASNPSAAENHLFSVDKTNLEDGNWHTSRIVVEPGRVVVYMDGELIKSFSHTFDPTYSGVGFSASTGFYIERHQLDDVKFTKLASVQRVVTEAVYAGPGDTIPIDITFDAPVEVSGAPVLHLNQGGVAAYAGNDGAGTLRFTYTLQEGDNFDALNYSGIDALDVTAGEIAAAGFPAVLTLPPVETGIDRVGLLMQPTGPAMMSVGDTLQLSVTADPLNGPPSNVTSTAVYSSSDTAVATVDSGGLVTAVGSGSAKIIVQHGGMSAELQVVSSAVQTGLAFGSSVPSPLTLALGESFPLQVNAVYNDGTNVDVTSGAAYSSSDTAVAVVDGSGRVTAAGIGSATITVQYGGMSADLQVVSTPAQTGLAFGASVPSPLTLAHGKTFPLQVDAAYSDETIVDVTSEAAYSSSDTTVATVDGNGHVTAAGVGSATITARYGGMSAELQVESTAVQTGLSFGATVPSPLTLAHRESFPLQVNAVYSDGTNVDVTSEATYNSSDTAVAAVDGSGRVTAAGIGTATITARYGGITINLRIISELTLAMLGFAPSVPGSLTLHPGETFPLEVVAVFSDGSEAAVTSEASYSSSDSSVATVDGSGRVKAAGNGAARITVTYGGYQETLELDVTVRSVSKIAAAESVIVRKETDTAPFSPLLTVTYSDGTSERLTSGYTLGSSNPAVIAANGAAIAVRKAGTAEVSATYKGHTQMIADVIVLPAKPDVSFLVQQIALRTDMNGDGVWTAQDARLLLALLTIE